MEPTYKQDDLIIVKEKSTYEVGEAITFETPTKEIFTHRIVDITNENEYITKGDNNEAEDPVPVERDKVYGKVINSHRSFLTSYLKFSRTVAGVIFLIIIPATMLATLWMNDLGEFLKKRYKQIH
jgi:signal peptidase